MNMYDDPSTIRMKSVIAGRVDGAARTGPEHERELRHDARELDVPPEDLRVAGERDDALLDPRAARVVDADHRAAVLAGEVEHLADLLGHDLRERAAEHGRVLREDEHPPAEHLPVAGDDGVAERAPVGHPEVRLAVTHEAVELDERARVAEPLGALARRQLAGAAPRLDGLLRAGMERLGTMLLEPLELRVRRLVSLVSRLGHPRSLTPSKRLHSFDGTGRPLDDLAVRRARRAGRLLLRALCAPDRRGGRGQARRARGRRRAALRLRDGRRTASCSPSPAGHDDRPRRRRLLRHLGAARRPRAVGCSLRRVRPDRAAARGGHRVGRVARPIRP